MGRAIAAAACAALCALLPAREAFAYCRSLACNEAKNCTRFYPDGRPIECPPVFWKSACVSFAVHAGGSPKLGFDADEVAARVEKVFDAWLTTSCGSRPPSLVTRYDGESSCLGKVFNDDAKNANVWMFYDRDWPHDSDQLALTTVSYGEETGRIVDVDVEVNSQDYDYAGGEANLDFVMLHEAGHFLGLDHSDAAGAVMVANYGLFNDTGSPPALSADDAAGICEIYPASRDSTDSCEPKNGFGQACAEAVDDEGCGCKVAGRRGPSPALPAVLAALSLSRLRRRRRARPRSLPTR